MPVLDLLVHPSCRRRLQVRGDDGVQRLLRRGERRGRPGDVAAHERGVRASHDHPCADPGGDLRGRAGVVVVEVGQHDAAQVLKAQADGLHRSSDRRAAAGRAGVDQGGAVPVVPQIGVGDAQPQQVQARDHIDHVHVRTLDA
jgi:hypothetical protein